MPSQRQNSLRVIRVTEGTSQHFFGYYDKHQWDETGRYLLTLQVDIADRSPRPDDVARIGMIDLEERNRYIPLGSTRAWCWQQGAMLQWLPGSPTSIIYNDRIERALDDLERLGLAGLAGEHHRAEAELADLDAGTAEAAVFHGLTTLR